jgi:hypothetical protein
LLDRFICRYLLVPHLVAATCRSRAAINISAELAIAVELKGNQRGVLKVKAREVSREDSCAPFVLRLIRVQRKD